MKSKTAFFTLVMLLAVVSLNCNANKTELFIASLLFRHRSVNSIELGIQLAIEAAENSSDFKDFLNKYKINVKSYYTKGKETNAIYTSTYVLLYHEGGYPLLLLGPQTSPEASRVLQVVRFYKKFMVTYLTTTSEMKETVDPYGITFAPTAYTFNKAVVKIMNHFKWKRAALVYDYSGKGGLYVKFADILEQMADFKITGIGAISTEEEMSLVNVNQDVREKIKRLQDLDTKIFIGAFDSRGAALVFCELFKMNNFGPESVWILHPDAGSVNDWDFHAAVERRKNKTGTCTKEEYEKAAEGVFILDKHILYRTDDKTVTSSGLSLRQVFDMAGVGALSDTSKIRMTTAFDTMWAILLALKESSAALPHSLPLEYNVENFLGRPKITETIESKLREVSFEGLTGLVSFTENEERGGILVIRQYQDSIRGLVPIGEHHTREDKFVSYNNTVWKDNQPPLDRTIIYREIQLMKISLPVTIAVWLFAAIGVAFSFGFLGFSIRNRQTRIIKMSSPNLNNIIVMGSILCYISVILFGIDGRFLTLEEYTRICNVRSAVLCIGYSLSFGAMFSKTWRVHKIFAAGASLKKMAIKDHHLLVTVAALLMTDVVFLSCWIATDPFQSEMRKFEETLGEVHREYQVVIIPALYQCTCKYKMYFFAVVFTYKGLLLLFGIFLAWETRNVTIPALNDSKYIGMSVYNVFVLSVIGAVVSLALEGSEHYNASYAILSKCLIMGTSLTMLLVFVPKIYHFYSKDEVTAQGIRAVHLMEGQNSQFSCKATQTTFNTSGCADNDALNLSDEVSPEATEETMTVALNPHTCQVVIKSLNATCASGSFRD